MANWKENGVVPDSDDEESLDTQSDLGFEDLNDAQQDDGLNIIQDTFGKDGVEEKGREPDHDKSPERSASSSRDSPEVTAEKTPTASTNLSERRELDPSSSPISPRVFKDPRTILSIDFSTPRQNGRHSFVDEAPHEELSQSYVQAASLSSSALSSLPASPRWETSMSKSSRELEKSRQQENANLASEESDVHILKEPTTFNRRFLRQRNLIQIHPYMMEQERYRRTLQARGMKPMRLVESEDHQSKNNRGSVTLDPYSQDDSQVVDVGVEESQSLSIDWKSAPPSPLTISSTKDRESDRSRSVLRDEDEFPDIDELANGYHSVSRRPESKRRLKSYSSKSRKLNLPNIQSQALGCAISRAGVHSNFAGPDSPPATSSPLPTLHRSIRTSLSRSLSESLSCVHPDWVDDDHDIVIEKSTDLPTPATSATKPVPESIAIHSDTDADTDTEDPFASPAKSHTASSSDELIQIRKVGKKIRGVLPASHLRLDQHLRKPIVPTRTHRADVSASPLRQLHRRGVAIPRSPKTGPNSSEYTNLSIPSLSDGSDEEDTGQRGFIMEDNDPIEMDSLFAQHRIGFAEEDDRIDAMLPTRKRKGRGSDVRPRKRRQVGTRTHQPKITEHLVRARKSTSKSKGTRTTTNYRSDLSSICSPIPRRPFPPRLGILDIMNSSIQSPSRLPRFLKIAARTARSKRDQGRQSPTRKFIKLANREDTIDAQSLLKDWRNGTLMKNVLRSAHTSKLTRAPLGRITGNVQTRLRSPTTRAKQQSPELDFGSNMFTMPRKLVVSRSVQRTMNDFVTTISGKSEQVVSKRGVASYLNVEQNQFNRPPFNVAQSRPAQLESSVLEYSRRHPVAAFGSTKKTLDSLYRAVRKRRTLQGNLQLSRFLADEDVPRFSIETRSSYSVDDPEAVDESVTLPKAPRNRKRHPQRIDAGAAIYRQPDAPLILDLTPSQSQDPTTHGDRLLGLGKFGTIYPIHFDTFPLQPGIFFHETTFIGSGRLAAATRSIGLRTIGVIRPKTSFQLGEKYFEWGLWDENVSSEIGLCFDWLIDQLNSQSTRASFSPDNVIKIIHSVVDYVQNSLSFRVCGDRSDFLTRVHEVIREFVSRVYSGDTDQTHFQSRIEVMTSCTALVLQLLRLSQTDLELSSLTTKLEELLVKAAKGLVERLLLVGVGDLRKLYDDLQFLSIRERGIRGSQYASHSWVVLMKVFNVAQIPRNSFWDVVNSQLLNPKASNIDDARMMEKVWYNIFSLLPLCEFNESGVVVENMRQRSSFDNWWVPQQMLKRVFMLYSQNSKQSPGFNDYCRAIVSRCHFLMVEWGWWKSGVVIGTLFDFFASQSLAHLRNEEVHKSPQFLDSLDKEPSLAVLPEDRCFHIFLKIVALTIKHMGQDNDEKGIRNLVTRLLPNRDRQYPKEDTILEKELAALRNHHDLLCTLYWAAPPDQRPSLSLMQDLVDADRSHNAACIINLRAWNQLARFVLTSSPGTASLEPFISWQSTFFTKLHYQYLQEDANTRKQADYHLKPGGLPFSEARLQEQIIANRRSTVVTVKGVLRNVLVSIGSVKNYADLLTAFDTTVLSSILSSEYSEECLLDVLHILMLYMDGIDYFHPHVNSTSNALPVAVENDSQNSFDLGKNIDRQVLIYPLCNRILPELLSLARNILGSSASPLPKVAWLETLIKCWARLASLASEENYNLKDFLPGGSRAVFVHRNGSERVTKLWPLYLAELLRYNALDKCDGPTFNLISEWMQILTIPATQPFYEINMSDQLLRQDFAFIREKSLLRARTISATAYSPLHLLKDAIDVVREAHQDCKIGIFPAALSFIRHGSLKSKNCHKVKAYFSIVLKDVMDAMQHHLESMALNSSLHIKYVSFSQEVVSYIRSRASNIQPLTKFFVTPSSRYWPEDSDPTLYAAGIISYSLRLRDDDPGRVSAELFHYLWRGWRNDLVKNQVQNHIAYVTKGLKHSDFLDFMLTNYLPAALQVGFASDCGWLISWTYLPPLAARLVRVLEKRDFGTAGAFRSSTNILKIILNGIVSHRLKWERGIRGLHPLNRGIVAVVCMFWTSILPALQAYVDDHPDQRADFDEVSNSLRTFAQQARIVFSGGCCGDWNSEPLNITLGPHVEHFVSMITDDMNNTWTVDLELIDEAMACADGCIGVLGLPPDSTQYRIELSRFWGRTLEEVVGAGISAYHGGAHVTSTDTALQASSQVMEIFF